MPIEASTSRPAIVTSLVSMPLGQNTAQRRHSLHWWKYAYQSASIASSSSRAPTSHGKCLPANVKWRRHTERSSSWRATGMLFGSVVPR